METKEEEEVQSIDGIYYILDNYDVISVIRSHITNPYDLLRFDLSHRNFYACRQGHMRAIPSILLAIVAGDMSHPWFSLNRNEILKLYNNDNNRNNSNDKLVKKKKNYDIEQRYTKWFNYCNDKGNQKKEEDDFGFIELRSDILRYRTPSIFLREHYRTLVTPDPLWCIVAPRFAILSDAQLTYVLSSISIPDYVLTTLLPLFSIPSKNILQWFRLNAHDLITAHLDDQIPPMFLRSDTRRVADERMNVWWLAEDEEERVSQIHDLLRDLKHKLSKIDLSNMDKTALLKNKDVALLIKILDWASGYGIHYRKRDVLIRLFNRRDLELIHWLNDLVSVDIPIRNAHLYANPVRMCKPKQLDLLLFFDALSVEKLRSYYSYIYLLLNQRHEMYTSNRIDVVIDHSIIGNDVPNCCELLELLDPDSLELNITSNHELFLNPRIPLEYIRWYIKYYSFNLQASSPISFIEELLHVAASRETLTPGSYTRIRDEIIPCLLDKFNIQDEVNLHITKVEKLTGETIFLPKLKEEKR